MVLPDDVLELMDQLENAGYQAWAVGGCVRDDALGIAPHDYDLCTSALPQEMVALFSQRQVYLAGLKHGTVSVVMPGGVVEVTTFRTEGDYTDSRHPGWVRFVPTIQEDLARRDFTINAMAYSPSRGYADPFGGREDLRQGVLRAVGNPEQRFREDALRILRGIRFAARFSLAIESETWQAMLRQRSGLDRLARERIFGELTQFLCLAEERDLLEGIPLLTQVIPELEPCVGLDQKNPHHNRDVYGHTAQVVARLPREPAIRLAGLLHDIGKAETMTLDETGVGHFYGHAQAGAAMAEGVLRRLKAPNAMVEEVTWLVAHHMDEIPLQEKAVRRCLSRYGLNRMQSLWMLQRADGGAAEPSDPRVQHLTALESLAMELKKREGELTLKTLQIKGGDLLAQGYPAGREIGQLLQQLLEAVVSGEVPNDKAALLQWAKELTTSSQIS